MTKTISISAEEVSRAVHEYLARLGHVPATGDARVEFVVREKFYERGGGSEHVLSCARVTVSLD